MEKQNIVTIPADRTDPTVYFTGTEEEQKEADRVEKERISMWSDILHTPGFRALRFDRENDYLILSPYTKGDEAMWQLSWFWHSDNLAVMDRIYGGSEGHPLSDLPKDLYKATKSTGARVFVVTAEKTREREKEEEIER